MASRIILLAVEDPAIACFLADPRWASSSSRWPRD
jgi:hypothetical protein